MILIDGAKGTLKMEGSLPDFMAEACIVTSKIADMLREAPAFIDEMLDMFSDKLIEAIYETNEEAKENGND